MTELTQRITTDLAALIALSEQQEADLRRMDQELTIARSDDAADDNAIATLTAQVTTLRRDLDAARVRIAEIERPAAPPVTTQGRTYFAAQVPSEPNRTDGAGSSGDYELGMRFSVVRGGTIQAIRYWKAAGETGTHTGRIWNSVTGQKLAEVVFTGETASGWQQQSLITPLSVQAGVTYIVSVNCNSHYALTAAVFASAITSNEISTGVSAGVFNNTPGLMPAASWNNSNYFRDVVFMASSAPAPTPAPTPAPAPAPTPSPAPTPTPAPAPGSALRGWQLTAANTGLAAHGINGSNLPEYTGPVAGDTGNYKPPAGSRISGVRFSRPVELSEGNIIIEKSLFAPTWVGSVGTFVTTTNYNTFAALPAKVIIRDCEFDGGRLKSDRVGWTDERYRSGALAFQGIADLQRNYIHNLGSGIALKITGTQLDALIEHNYVVNLVGWGDPGTSGSHNNALTIRDFTDAQRPERVATIRNNRFELNTPNNASSSIQVSGTDGRTDNVTIQGNFLEGYGYNMWLVQAGNGYSNMVAIDNRFRPLGFGVAYSDSPGWSVWRDNFIYSATAPDGRGAVVNP